MAKEKVHHLDLLEPILAETFGLERLYENTPLLNEWLSASYEFSASDLSTIQESQLNLLENADSWNEEELKMGFISIVIFLSRFKKPVRIYYDRDLSATIGEFSLRCKADMLLSSGIGELIKTPYFFLHEYKREKKYSGDPVGQMLGGMLIGQAKNNNGKPMYGCYVQGRFWFFSILEGKQYVISPAYDASKLGVPEQIISVLIKLKEIILSGII